MTAIVQTRPLRLFRSERAAAVCSSDAGFDEVSPVHDAVDLHQRREMPGVVGEQRTQLESLLLQDLQHFEIRRGTLVDRSDGQLALQADEALENISCALDHG